MYGDDYIGLLGCWGAGVLPNFGFYKQNHFKIQKYVKYLHPSTPESQTKNIIILK